MHEERADIVIVGAGAAGLTAAIFAGRTAREAATQGPGALRIVALDGARTLGAKILVAGGGRCNVTHHHVDETAYAGSSRHAIKQVLRAFDVPRTIALFEELGVELKREETGKLFPTTDSARTVLNALLDECRRVGAELHHPWRVASVERRENGFVVSEAPRADGAPPRQFIARRVILCTGGKALPKSGSDGAGYDIARSLGHTISPRVFPALVPLVLQDTSFVRTLSGITLPATLTLRAASGKKLESFTNSTLCTHFGLSGPGVLDISRYWQDAAAEARESGSPPPALVMNWLPAQNAADLDALFQRGGKRTAFSILRPWLPERVCEALVGVSNVDVRAACAALTREQRRALVTNVIEMPVPVVGERGYTYAEATAGGVPLSEVHLATMESRVTPGLHLAGELCDVDGRIGGFNFQWAWSSGHVAGGAAARALLTRA
jgi:predicted Rossmann fold flavoprotein